MSQARGANCPPNRIFHHQLPCSLPAIQLSSSQNIHPETTALAKTPANLAGLLPNRSLFCAVAKHPRSKCGEHNYPVFLQPGFPNRENAKRQRQRSGRASSSGEWLDGNTEPGYRDCGRGRALRGLRSRGPLQFFHVVFVVVYRVRRWRARPAYGVDHDCTDSWPPLNLRHAALFSTKGKVRKRSSTWHCFNYFGMTLQGLVNNKCKRTEKKPIAKREQCRLNHEA